MGGGIEDKLINTTNEIRVRCSLNRFWKFLKNNNFLKNYDEQNILNRMYLPSENEGVRIVKMNDGELQFPLVQKKEVRPGDLIIILKYLNGQYFLENIAKIPGEIESGYDVGKEDYVELCMNDKNKKYPILGCIKTN